MLDPTDLGALLERARARISVVGGLPVAVQLVAKSWDEARLLGVAQFVESTLASTA